MRPRLAGVRRREGDERRQRLEPLARERFAALDPAIVDGFFDNFGYAMPLSLVEQLVALVRAQMPSLAVEVGAGISTLALSNALAEHGGYLVSIEQEPDYARAAMRPLVRPDCVALVCASEPAELAGLTRGWKPGLVVVDGPAGDRFGDEWLALYRSLLSPGCVCAIDDTDRPENDAAAAMLADECALEKRDFADPVLPGHRYSILLPAGVEPPLPALPDPTDRS